MHDALLSFRGLPLFIHHSYIAMLVCSYTIMGSFTLGGSAAFWALEVDPHTVGVCVCWILTNSPSVALMGIAHSAVTTTAVVLVLTRSRQRTTAQTTDFFAIHFSRVSALFSRPNPNEGRKPDPVL